MGFSLSIISTIAYFDIFDYPLTAWEIWKYLYGVRAQYIDIVNKLDDLASEGGIETRNGFYFLPKRNAIVNVRLERYLIAEKKYKKGQKVTGVIIKYNRHGALASIEEGIAGLIHISEFENEEKLRKTLELGKTYNFIITLFDSKEQKMALSWKEANK